MRPLWRPNSLLEISIYVFNLNTLRGVKIKLLILCVIGPCRPRGRLQKLGGTGILLGLLRLFRLSARCAIKLGKGKFGHARGVVHTPMYIVLTLFLHPCITVALVLGSMIGGSLKTPLLTIICGSLW